jgi:hypothetical protein
MGHHKQAVGEESISMLITAELRKPRSSSEAAPDQLLLLQLCRGGLGLKYNSYSNHNLQALESYYCITA